MAKVLIVDDDPDSANLLERFIIANKHQAYSIVDSRVAAKAVESYQPDLIITDIMMPHINGVMLCKQIKAEATTNHIPVIIVSALDDDNTKKDVANAGAEFFMTKPIAPKIFIQQINSILSKQ